MTHTRPDPDALLAHVTHEESRATRGKLKVFFGSNAGVGKTYAMLDEARKLAAEGADVLIGYAEPHIRPDTEALLLGLDILPYKLVPYKGATLKEFDLDAALIRRPALLCVDELAHSNAPGLRHPKRWQDVEELLTAGINVYATLNVQHLESVNDIVERITGVRVQETMPDSVLDGADEVELVDIAPDELMDRLREGKVYKPHQAEQALKHFFNRGNLIALRELALRKTAERVDAQMQDARHAASSARPWAASERILVCIGPSPFAPQLVRSAKRLAAAFRAPWVAAYVEIAGGKPLTPSDQNRLNDTLRLAEQLGGQAVTLSGASVAEGVLTYARQKNITKIVAGKPEQARWKELLRPSPVDELIRQSGQIDVYVIRPDVQSSPRRHGQETRQGPRSLRSYALAVLVVVATTLLGALLYHVGGASGTYFSNTNVLMLDLLGILLVASRWGRGPAALASVLAVALFDFTVVPPYYTFAVSDAQYILTFAVMLATGLLIGTLTDRVRRQGETARVRERRTAALLSFSSALAATRERTDVAKAAAAHVADIFDGPAVLFLPNNKGQLAQAAASHETDPLDEKEIGVIAWVHEHGQPAGCGTDTLPSAAGRYVPVTTGGHTLGVLGLLAPAAGLDPERLRLLDAFADQTAIAIERAALAEESRKAWERVEAEFLRNTLLSGVSHDLRTPLATITGAASSLVDAADISPDARRDLATQIVSESERMERLITNLLDMTRLESGGLRLRREWHPLAEIVGSSIRHAAKSLGTRRVVTDLAAELPLVNLDALAMEQVLVNLFDNAANYTPADTPIELSVRTDDAGVVIDVADHGPGLPLDDPQRVFQKFYRGPRLNRTAGDDGSRRGLGLGLAICRGIVELHGGTIAAENRPADRGGGALFRIRLPLGGTPPPPPPEPDTPI